MHKLVGVGSGSGEKGGFRVVGMNDVENLTVAVIGAPSSCESAVLNLSTAAYHLPLLGKMLAFQVAFEGDSDELALATVTHVETVNPLHSMNSSVVRHIADNGAVAHKSGDAADTRAVTVKVEAVFKKVDGVWTKHSSTLSNSPATGTPVRVLSQAMVNEVLGDSDQDACIGSLRGSGVRIPLTLEDFSGVRGACHMAVVGVSGSGKTATSTAFISSLLRHAGQGHIIFDPQGQWSTEHGTLWSLQGLARSLGRKVTVARLSHSLRLRKDAPLLMNLLEEAGFFKKLAFGSGADDNVAQAKDVLAEALSNKRLLERYGIEDWSSTRPDVLLRFLLNELHEQLPAGMIYASREPQRRVASTIYRPTEDSDGHPLEDHLLDRIAFGALDDGGERKFATLMAIFAPLSSLWSPWSPTGMAKILAGVDGSDLVDEDLRRDAWGLMMEVMSPPAGHPAPMLILDLSADLSSIKLDGDDSGEDDVDAADAIRILDSVDVKARVMAQLSRTMLLVGQREFSRGTPLNVLTTVDEAWAYAPQPDARVHSQAVISLSNLLAGAARDARKLGIGFLFILQAPSGLREDIFKQITVLFVGYGLHEPAELKLLSGRVRDNHLKLYQTTPPPAATGRYVWMVVGGGVTGLSFGSNPVFLEVFNTGEQWLEANQGWVTAARRQAAGKLPQGDFGGPLTTMPLKPVLGGVEGRQARRAAVVDAGANKAAVTVVAAQSKPTRRPVVKPVSTSVVKPVIDNSIWPDDPPF